MINGTFTVFAKPIGANCLEEILWIETTDAKLAQTAINGAPSRGYEITRVYKPTTQLDAPDFRKALNI